MVISPDTLFNVFAIAENTERIAGRHGRSFSGSKANDAWQCTAGPGLARQGKDFSQAGLGMARLGKARQGAAGQGF